jgi:cytochrome oxidase Cu insertion factor (SCO1/SenC/PrrC family)
MSKKLMVIVMASLIVGLTWMVYAPTSTPTRTRIDVSQLGPQVGERVPDFSLPDQNGQLRTLNSIMGPNGALLLFHRSASW